MGATMYALPVGCGGIMRGGLYYCSGIYYRPVMQGGTTVYIVDSIDPGANTSIEYEEYY